MTTIDQSASADPVCARPAPSSRHFHATTIDGSPDQMLQSYELRYRVYCVERKFLNADSFPDGREMDEHDAHSVHVAAISTTGQLAGTARVVVGAPAGLPLLEHCTLFPHEAALAASSAHSVEVGRLSVSRNYNRRALERKNGFGDVFLTLLKALYQATRRVGGTHWLAATEKPLQRMLAQHGFPFRQIGPDSEYFGVVAPYVMDLEAFEAVILSGRFPSLEDFWVGLEPEFLPGGRSLDVLRASIAPAPVAPESRDEVGGLR